MPTLVANSFIAESVTTPNFVELTPTVTFQENDLLLLEVVMGTDVIPTPPPGFYLVPDAYVVGVATNVRIYQKYVGSDPEPTTYRVHFPSGAVCSAGILACRGSTLAYPVIHKVDAASTAVASTNKVWDAVSPTDTNTLLLCFGGFAVGGGSTPHAGMTERWDEGGSTVRIYLMTEAIAAAGSTGTRTATGTSATLIRTVTISVSESATQPEIRPLPAWAIWSEASDITTVYPPAISSSINTFQNSDEQSFDYRLYLAPPPNAVRVKVRNNWSFTRNDVGFGSATNLLSGFQTVANNVGDSNNSANPPGNGTASGFYDPDFELVVADWGLDTENIEASTPPTGTPTGSGSGTPINWLLQSSSGGHADNFANASLTVEVLEIELEDGSIFSEGAVVTELPVLVELEGEGAQVTQMGVFAEIAASGIYLTELPVYAEFAAIGIYLTAFPLLIELEEFTPEVEMPTNFPRTDGTRAMHRLLPDEVTGYAFDPDYSWWSSIVAEKSTNLIINPSFERWNALDIATEYDDGGSLTSLDYVEFPAVGATAGRRCARLVSGGGSGWIEYDEGLAVTPGPYTFACDVYVTRVPFTIYMAITGTGGATTYATRSFRVEETGWHRYSIGYVELGSGNRECRLTLINTNPAGVTVYTDAWQFEAKAYATTYLDGDSIGFNDVRAHQSYYWHGEPHASPSTRYETTGSGGRIVSWGDKIGFKTTGIVGLDMTSVEVETQQLGDGREIHRSSNELARNFTIVGRIFAGNGRELSNKMNRLVSLVKPNNTLDAEQIMLRYQQVDSDEQLVGPPLEIVCAYSDGLQGNMTNFYQEALALQFHASHPYMREVIDSSAEITINKTLIENSIFFRDADGDYVNLGTGTTSGGSILGIGFARDGSPVAVGTFTQIAGDAIARAARWDGSNWVDYGAPTVGLQFLNDGRKLGYEPAAVYDAAGVAIYNDLFDQWLELGNPFLGTVLAIDRDTDGNVWVAGEFATDDPAVTTFNNVAKWDYDAEEWQALGTGLTDPGALNPDLKALTVLATNDGYVYFGGWFEQGNYTAGTTLANSAIRWNIATQEWEAMGSGLNAAPNKFIQGEDGFIYAVGEFDQNGTEAFDLRGFARYNGYEWEEVFPLQRVDGTYGADGVTIDENGVFWFYGYGLSFPDDYFDIPELGQVGTFGWKDGTFYPPFADVTLREMAVGPGGAALYNGFGVTGDDVLVPALNTIDYPGTADAPLAFFLDGPAHPVHVLNLSTKGGLYFKYNFDVGDMEKMVARSDTQKAMIYSNARSNLYKFVSAGISSLKSLRLRPGINRISVFIEDEGDTTLAWVTWKNRYQALAGPVED